MIQIHIARQIWLLVILLALLLLATLWAYRRTTPPVSRKWRFLLAGLRYIALALLTLVIFETTLEYRKTKSKPALLAIAIDQSASMAITDASGSRPELLTRALENIPFNDGLTPVYYTFGHQVRRLQERPDSLIFNQDVTDIETALRSITQDLLQDNLVGIVLLSDGNYSQGMHPAAVAEGLGVPVFPVSIGSPDANPDLLIGDMRFNPFVYTHEPSPIELNLVNRGFKAMRTSVQLLEDNKILETRSISISKSPSEQHITLQYLPSSPGRKKLTVRVNPAADEQTVENNSRSVYVDVLKSRLNVQLLAGSLSPTISTLRRHLQQSDRHEIQIAVENRQGGWYSFSQIPENLDRVDILILLDFPGPYTPPDRFQQIVNLNPKPSFLIFSGSNTDWSKLAQMQDHLPFTRVQIQTNAIEGSAELTRTGQLHPITSTGIDNNNDFWQKLPPLFSNLRSVKLWPDAEILTTFHADKPKTNLPLIVVRQKSAVFFASPLWRWDLMLKGVDSESEFFSLMLNNTLRWLEKERSDELVRVTLPKNTFHFGETVPFTIRVFDAKLNPVNDALVLLTVESGNETQQITATPEGDGRWSVDFHPQQGGQYRYTAQASQQDRALGQQQGVFEIGDYSRELFNTRVDEITLERIARAGNGRLLLPQNMAALDTLVQKTTRISTESREDRIWNHPLTLIVIIITLSLEWFLRKRKGML